MAENLLQGLSAGRSAKLEELANERYQERLAKESAAVAAPNMQQIATPVSSTPEKATPQSSQSEEKSIGSKISDLYTKTIIPAALQGVGLGSIAKTATGEAPKDVQKAGDFAQNVNRSLQIDAHKTLAATLAMYNKGVSGMGSMFGVNNGPDPMISKWIETNYRDAQALEKTQEAAKESNSLGTVGNAISQNPVISAAMLPVAAEVGGAYAAGGAMGALKSATYIGSVGMLYDQLASRANKAIDAAHNPEAGGQELETNIAQHALVNTVGGMAGGVAAAMLHGGAMAKTLGSKIMSGLKNPLTEAMNNQATVANEVLQLNRALTGKNVVPQEVEAEASSMNYHDIVKAHNENSDQFAALINKNLLDPKDVNFAPEKHLEQLTEVQTILGKINNPIYQEKAGQLKTYIDTYTNNQKASVANFDTLATNEQQNPLFQAELNKSLDQFKLQSGNPNATVQELPEAMKVKTLYNYAANIQGDIPRSIRVMIDNGQPAPNTKNLIDQHVQQGVLTKDEGNALLSYSKNVQTKNQVSTILDSVTERVTKDPNLIELDKVLASTNNNMTETQIADQLAKNGVVGPVATQVARNVSANNFISQYAEHLGNGTWTKEVNDNFLAHFPQFEQDAKNGVFLRETTEKLNHLNELRLKSTEAGEKVNNTTRAITEQAQEMQSSLGTFFDPSNSGRIDSLMNMKGNNEALATNFLNLFNNYRDNVHGRQYKAWERNTADAFQNVFKSAVDENGKTNPLAIAEGLKQSPLGQQLAKSLLSTAKILSNNIPGAETSVLSTKDGAFILSNMAQVLDREIVNDITPTTTKVLSKAEQELADQGHLNTIYDSLASKLVEKQGSARELLETFSNFNDLIAKRASGYDVHPQMSLSQNQYKELQRALKVPYSELRKAQGEEYYKSQGFNDQEASELVTKLNSFYSKFRGFREDVNKKTGLHLDLEGLHGQETVSNLSKKLQDVGGTPYLWIEDNLKPVHGAATDFFNTLHKNDGLMQSYLANKFTLSNQDVSEGMARSIASSIANEGKTGLTPQELKMAIGKVQNDNMSKLLLTQPKMGEILFKNGAIERNGVVEPYQGLKSTSEIIDGLSNQHFSPEANVNMKLIQQNYPELYTQLQSSFRDKIISDASTIKKDDPAAQMKYIKDKIQSYSQTFGEHFTHFTDADGQKIPNLSLQELDRFVSAGIKDPEGAQPYVKYMVGLGELSKFTNQLNDIKKAASTLHNPTINAENKSILQTHLKQMIKEADRAISEGSSTAKLDEKELQLIRKPLDEMTKNLDNIDKLADNIKSFTDKNLPRLMTQIKDAQKLIQSKADPKHNTIADIMNAVPGVSLAKKPFDLVSSLSQKYMEKRYKKAYPDLLAKEPSFPYGQLQNKAAVKSIGDSIQSKKALSDYYDKVSKTKFKYRNAALMGALMSSVGD